MADMIYTLPGLWMTRVMVQAARLAASSLDEAGDVAIVEAAGRRYAVARISARLLKVCLESDLPEVLSPEAGNEGTKSRPPSLPRRIERGSFAGDAEMQDNEVI